MPALEAVLLRLASAPICWRSEMMLDHSLGTEGQVTFPLVNFAVYSFTG